MSGGPTTAEVARPATRRRVPLWLPAVAGGVLVVALVIGGGAPQAAPAGIPDPGPVTGWGLPLLRLLTDLAAVAAVGLALAAALLLPAPSPQLRGERARDAASVAVAGLVVALGALVQIPLTLSNVLAVPPTQALSPTLVSQFVTETDVGRALAVQVVIAAVAAVTAAVVGTVAGACWLLVLTLGMLVPQALAGHAATATSHTLAVASLLVHVLAAALWTGGLLALAVAARRGVAGLRYAVPRFSTLALWCFVAVAAVGDRQRRRPAGVRRGAAGHRLRRPRADEGGRAARARRRSGSGTAPGRCRAWRSASAPRGPTRPPASARSPRSAVAELAVMAGTFGRRRRSRPDAHTPAAGAARRPRARPCSASRCRRRRPPSGC